MEKQLASTNEFSLERIITTAVQIPGVRVERDSFLKATFADENLEIQDILDYGPIEANCSQERLKCIAENLILKRTSESSIASFLTGLPGGLAMAATIPADVLQFFGMILRLAQELSYLYGAQDLWENGQVDDERVKSQLIMYCGVMFGISGAAAGVRVLSTQIAKTTLKKLPQKALTKTFWYPIIKQIGKAIGVKVTKSTVAKGVSKAIPVIGGVISGTLNFVSMKPMAKKLHEALESAAFGYTEEKMNLDFEEIENIIGSDESDIGEPKVEKANAPILGTVNQGFKNIGNGISGLFGKRGDNSAADKKQDISSHDDVFVSIEKLSKLKEIGAITEEEYNKKKKELLAKL